MRPRGRVPRRAIGVRGGRVGVGGMGERGGTQRRRLYDGRLWESERPRDAMLRAAPVWPRGKLWGGRGAGAGALCVIMCVIHGCVRCWRRRLTPDTADTRARAPARGALGSEVAYLLIYSCIVKVIVTAVRGAFCHCQALAFGGLGIAKTCLFETGDSLRNHVRNALLLYLYSSCNCRYELLSKI